MDWLVVIMPRAQIFQSFDALKGFRELLKEQEYVVVPMKQLSEDALEQLNYTIYQVKVGMMVRLIYAEKGVYIQVEGKVSKLNLDTKMIQIVKKKINIPTIVSIEILI